MGQTIIPGQSSITSGKKLVLAFIAANPGQDNSMNRSHSSDARMRQILSLAPATNESFVIRVYAHECELEKWQTGMHTVTNGTHTVETPQGYASVWNLSDLNRPVLKGEVEAEGATVSLLNPKTFARILRHTIQQHPDAESIVVVLDMHGGTSTVAAEPIIDNKIYEDPIESMLIRDVASGFRRLQKDFGPLIKDRIAVVLDACHLADSLIIGCFGGAVASVVASAFLMRSCATNFVVPLKKMMAADNVPIQDIAALWVREKQNVYDPIRAQELNLLLDKLGFALAKGMDNPELERKILNAVDFSNYYDDEEDQHKGIIVLESFLRSLEVEIAEELKLEPLVQSIREGIGAVILNPVGDDRHLSLFVYPKPFIGHETHRRMALILRTELGEIEKGRSFTPELVHYDLNKILAVMKENLETEPDGDYLAECAEHLQRCFEEYPNFFAAFGKRNLIDDLFMDNADSLTDLIVNTPDDWLSEIGYSISVINILQGEFSRIDFQIYFADYQNAASRRKEAAMKALAPLEQDYFAHVDNGMNDYLNLDPPNGLLAFNLRLAEIRKAEIHQEFLYFLEDYCINDSVCA